MLREFTIPVWFLSGSRAQPETNELIIEQYLYAIKQ